MTSLRSYRTFNDLRQEMRGSANWSNHIDEIAEHAGKALDENDSKAGLFDSFEDFDDDDE
jgi:hypothetical protein